VEQLLLEFLAYAIVGVITGVLAGLFGIGGGAIIVPVLIVSFTLQGLSPEVLTHLAIGTSLAVITLTASSSVWAHHGHGAIRWPLFWKLTPAIVLGVWGGALFAAHLNGPVLQKCFGGFLILVAVQMYSDWHPGGHDVDKTEEALPGVAGLGLAGLLIGSVSALFGIGGGSLSLRMQQSVATASAIGLPIAISGSLSYAWNGWGNALLPEGATGYIYWPAFAGIAITSVMFARVGARLAHSLEPRQLKKIFALFSLAIGCYLLFR
jgi:uncharacterized membrane protein YfcA